MKEHYFENISLIFIGDVVENVDGTNIYVGKILWSLLWKNIYPNQI